MTELLGMTDLIITNGVLGWVGLRLVKRVDKLDNHEARLQLTEHQLQQRGVNFPQKSREVYFLTLKLNAFNAS